ncbi:MAG TPA: hypothetical protein EYG98_01500 [Sulfurovum sp.]|nr:hypothetical protein [Sulfurovum sp.]
MLSLQTQDSYIMNIFETKFHNDKSKFFDAVKYLFKTENKAEQQEYNLLKAYQDGDLSIGQVAKIFNITKFEVMGLLEKYNIPFVTVDEEYLNQEFNAFSS